MERVKGVWLKVFKGGAVSALLMATFFLLSSCGGGGEVTPTETTLPTQGFQLSGMIASGKALQTLISFRDANGNTYTTSDLTGADGKYTNVDLTAQGLTPPVLIRVRKPSGDGWLYSYASKSGRANIHPLTDPIIRAWHRVKYPGGNLDYDFNNTADLELPTQDEIDFIKAVILDVVKNLLTAVAETTEGLVDADNNPISVEDFDPMETSFNATGDGFDKILDYTTVDISEETGDLNILVEPDSDLEDNIEDTGGSTMYTLNTDGIDQNDETAPGKPAAPTAVQVDTKVLVTWEANLESDLAYYRVYKYENEIYIGAATATSTCFIFPDLDVGQSYTFTIFACDGAGNYSEESDLSDPVEILGETTIDDTAGTTVGTVMANLFDYNKIKLTWHGFADDDGIVCYRVYACDDQGANLELIDEVQGEYFIQLGLAAHTEYCYAVTAVDAAGIESGSSVDCELTLIPPVVDNPPAVPTDFSAVATSPNQIELTWAAPPDPEGDLDGYYIYLDTNEIVVLQETALSYTDSGLDPNTAYSYNIKAIDYHGKLSTQAQTSAKTPPYGEYPDVSVLITAAKGYLEAQDIPEANEKFKEAYNLNPTNKDANFGSAITDLIMLLEDSEVVNFLSNYETYKPTIDNIVYEVLNNTYQVWGGNSPLCDNEALDPNSHGYIKLSDSESPVTDFTGYSYYVIYTPPFSEIDVIVSGDGISRACEWWWVTGQISANIGGSELFGDSLTIHAPNGMSLSVQDGVQQKALIKKVRGKFSATDVKEDDESILVNEIKSLFNKLPKNKTSLSARLKSRAKSLLDEPPTPSDVQALINSTLLPTVSGVISKLRVVEGSGYTFTITPAMTGGAEELSTVLDDGEFYALDAMLSLLKGIMNVLTAYDLDIDYKIIEYDPLSQINNSTFFTLKSDGATRMTNALTSLRDAVNSAESAYTFIFNEWGYDEITVEGCAVLAPTNTVTDNGIQLHDEDSSRTCEYGGLYNFTPKDDTDIKNGLNAAQMALAGQVTYKEEVVDSVWVDSVYDDGTNIIIFETEEVNESDGVKFSVVFDVTKFFTNPLDKTDLPTFDYDLPINLTQSQIVGEPVHLYAGPDGDELICCDIYMTSDLPDYTLNGIFPAGIPEFNGLLIFESAVVLDKQTWEGWNQAVASDANSIYLYKQDYSGADSGKIWKINPSTGNVTDTYNLSLNYLENGICWIADMTWHSGALWASGGYGDATNNMTIGVFQIDPNSSQSSNQRPADQNLFWGGGGLASDQTDLYLGANIMGVNGIIKFDPSSVTEVPTTLSFPFDKNLQQVVYGGGYLWLDDGTLKVDPSNGDIVKEYWCQEWINAYLNGKLYSIDEWDRIIRVFIVPGT